MTERQRIIRTAYHRFESQLRPARWAAIDEVLADAGHQELDSTERDAVDEAVTMGGMPFDGALSPSHEQETQA